jgi:hypothetical protein
MAYYIVARAEQLTTMDAGLLVTKNDVCKTRDELVKKINVAAMRGSLPIVLSVNENSIVKHNFDGEVCLGFDELKLTSPASLGIENKKAQETYGAVKTAIMDSRNEIKKTASSNTAIYEEIDSALTAFGVLQEKPTVKSVLKKLSGNISGQQQAKVFLEKYNESLQEAKKTGIRNAENAALMTAIKKTGV